MANATAITIPQENFASSYVLICESHNEKISKMLAIAEMLQTPEDKLLQRYFRGMDNYFGKDLVTYSQSVQSNNREKIKKPETLLDNISGFLYDY